MGSGASSLAESKYSSSHSYDKKDMMVMGLDNHILDGDNRHQLRLYQHKVTRELASFFVQDEASSFFSDPSGSDYNEKVSISSSGREYLRDLKASVVPNASHQPSEGRRSVNSAGSYEEQRMMMMRSSNIPLMDHEKDSKSYCTICKNEFEVTQMQWDNHLKACSSRCSLKNIFEDLDRQVNLAFLALSLDVPLNSLVKSYIAGIISVKYYCNVTQIYFLRNEIRGYLQGMISDSTRSGDDSDDALVLTSEVGLGNKLITALEVLKKKEDLILQNVKYLPKIADYDIFRSIGKGSFAEVFVGRCHETNQFFALKVFSKRRFKTIDQIDLIVKERKTMCLLNRYRDQFVHLFNAFQTSTDLYLVMEYMQGGDCLSLLTKLRTFPEALARHIIAQVAMAVEQLHSNGLVHRDIKPDNVFLTGRGHAKLGDFGSTIPIQKERNAQLIVEFQPKKYREAPDLGSEGGSGGNSSSTSSVSLQYTAVRPISDFVGNYFYASPEIVSGTGLYDQSVDWWAVGVMLFHVLAGITPFEDKNEQKDITLANIENMECNWGDLPSEVSKDCRQFLQSILCEKLDTRLGTPTSSSSSSSSSAPSSPNTVLRHPFFRPIDFSVLYEARSPYQDIADSFSLGLEGSCYWLDERRAVVPAFEKEELIRNNLTDEEKSHLENDPYSDFNYIDL